MSVQRKVTKYKTDIKLSGEMTIYQAAEIHSQLVSNRSGLDRKVVLNLEQVEDIDTSGVQLLMMLSREVAAQGGVLNIGAISDRAEHVLSVLGWQFEANKENDKETRP